MVKQKRGPSKFRTIRKIAQGSNGDIVKGISIPNNIADKFQNVSFSINYSEDKIILASGCRNG